MILLEFGFTLFLNELLSWLLRFSPTSFSPQNAKQLHVMQGRLFRLKASIVAIFPAIPNIPTTNTPIPNIKHQKMSIISKTRKPFVQYFSNVIYPPITFNPKSRCLYNVIVFVLIFVACDFCFIHLYKLLFEGVHMKQIFQDQVRCNYNQSRKTQ